jgi:tetratricopeptide (TPR) repeat protein
MPDGIDDHIGIVRHLVIEHHPDPSKSRGQYLPLIELAVREDPDSPRQALYLGREYVFHARYDEALVELGRYLEIAPDNEIGQLCAARRLIARCHENLEGLGAALEAYRVAAEAAPEVRGPQVDYAWMLYRGEQWEACYAQALKAIALPDMIFEYGYDSEFGVLPEDMAAICGWRLGHQHQALVYGRQALAKAPAVDRIRLNVERMEQALGVATTR